MGKKKQKKNLYLGCYIGVDTKVMEQRFRRRKDIRLPTDQVEEVVECVKCGYEYKDAEGKCVKCGSYNRHTFVREVFL